MKKATKASSKQAPIIAKGNEAAVLTKLVRSAASYDAAWGLVRRAFPRATFGKVRDVVQKFSQYKTLKAAFTALRGKTSTRRASAKKSAAKKPVAKEEVRQAA